MNDRPRPQRPMPRVQQQVELDAASTWVGQRIDRLVQAWCGRSRSQVAALFDHGCVQLNGLAIHEPGRLLAVGDRVALSYDPQRRYRPLPRPRAHLGFTIVHEDPHLIVVDKPAGMLTVPTPRGERLTLRDRVRTYLRYVRKVPEAWVVHRLDRDVSGLLVLAKSAAVAQRLKQQFAAGKPLREYLALVAGHVRQEQGTFESWLATAKNLDRYSTRDPQHGELAITHWRVVARLRGATLVQVRLETGRRNQIRVHFAEAGHPVLGETRYRPDLAVHPDWSHGRLALHAHLLGLEHPASGELLRWHSPLPSEMQEFLRHARSARRRK
jgi:23S rRNA pseudouridine1911/1915/1917 synthase